jgi:S-adenosylmethionine synthetase
MQNDLVYRLRYRAEIRRQILTRKSVQEGAPDRIADLLEEAADEIVKLKETIAEIKNEN